jgi:hypothetical protein
MEVMFEAHILSCFLVSIIKSYMHFVCSGLGASVVTVSILGYWDNTAAATSYLLCIYLFIAAATRMYWPPATWDKRCDICCPC